MEVTQSGRGKARGCLHDAGMTFIPVRVHSGSLLCLCIRLHDTSATSHSSMSNTGISTDSCTDRVSRTGAKTYTGLLYHV